MKHALPILEDLHGTKFVSYPGDRANAGKLVRGTADIDEFLAVKKLIRPGDVAFDVGANIGFYTVWLSRLCGPTGRVWAFEPVPETHWRLVETLALNRCENVIPVRNAICDRDEIVRMNLFEEQFAQWNTLGRPSMQLENGKRVSPSSSIAVKSRSLDQFCCEESVSHIRFLKVDVEGFELPVFQGARDLLSSGRIDFVCFEISQEPLKGAGFESRKVFAELESQGYSSYQFERRTGVFRGPVRDTSEYWTNFFASRIDLSKI